MMMHLLKDSPDEKRVVFANTGQEDERTLEFVNRCSLEWGIDIAWIEPVVNTGRKGSTHKVVTFKTATRDPSLFEAMIKKYGIPNKNYPHCTRELKLNPITSFARSIGWEKGAYRTAVGIRADEIDRVNPHFERLSLYYPLCDSKVRKADVFAFWDKQGFDLQVPEHRGNCVWCWKKSLRKHLTLARETPQVFEFAMRMEQQHAFSGGGVGPRVFFRGRKTAKEIIELSRENFEAFVDPRHLDQGGGCEESCEVHDGQEEMDALWEEAAV